VKNRKAYGWVSLVALTAAAAAGFGLQIGCAVAGDAKPAAKMDKAAAKAGKTVGKPPLLIMKAPMGREIATFAAGCFWSMESIFKQLKGVAKVEPGYAGGDVAAPSYEAVGTGTTGHAETVNVVFDPKVISYSTLLDVLFTVHDPTTLNRQGNDEGSQYRSAIFTHSAAQQVAATDVIKKLNGSKHFESPIVTTVQPFTNFYRAEDYHLNYYNLHPGESYCRFVIKPKIDKFHAKFADKMK